MGDKDSVKGGSVIYMPFIHNFLTRGIEYSFRTYNSCSGILNGAISAETPSQTPAASSISTTRPSFLPKDTRCCPHSTTASSTGQPPQYHLHHRLRRRHIHIKQLHGEHRYSHRKHGKALRGKTPRTNPPTLILRSQRNLTHHHKSQTPSHTCAYY